MQHDNCSIALYPVLQTN